MKEFQVGDTVTRDGTDRHVVLAADDGFGNMDVMCTREPITGWIKRGEVESNLSERYALVKRAKVTKVG